MGKSWRGKNGNEEVLRNPQSSIITEALTIKLSRSLIGRVLPFCWGSRQCMQNLDERAHE